MCAALGPRPFPFTHFTLLVLRNLRLGHFRWTSPVCLTSLAKNGSRPSNRNYDLSSKPLAKGIQPHTVCRTREKQWDRLSQKKRKSFFFPLHFFFLNGPRAAKQLVCHQPRRREDADRNKSLRTETDTERHRAGLGLSRKRTQDELRRAREHPRG